MNCLLQEGRVVGFDKKLSAKAVAADRKVKKELAEKAINDKIINEIHELGIKGKIEIMPKDKIDVSDFTFDDEHINKERVHNVSREDAERFIKESDVSVTRWNGRYVNYYSPAGAAFVDINEKNIRTAFHCEQFDIRIVKMRKVLKKYGKD